MKNSLMSLLALLSPFLIAYTQEVPETKAAQAITSGIQAFSAGRYEEAVNHFESALAVDPDVPDGNLHLARAYARRFIPGLLTEENGQSLRRALDSFDQHLKRDPGHIESLLALGSLYQSIADFGRAREYYLKATALAPRNPEPLYAVGSIDWYLVFNKAAPRPLDEQRILVEEGLEKLNTAVAIDSQHYEAMSFLNLLFREKARLTDDPKEKADLIARADQWYERSLATRQARTQPPAPSQTPLTGPPAAPAAATTTTNQHQLHLLFQKMGLEQDSTLRPESGIVVGRVVNRDGSPAASVIITAVSVADPGAGRTRTAARTLTSNDGVYRLEITPAGSYYIEAGFPGMGVYYPGTRTLNEAVAITVGNDQTIVGVDFSFAR